MPGIQTDPASPGWKKFIIQPAVVGDLTWVKAHYDSPYGRIASEWKRRGNNLQLNIVVPPNTTATVFVPARAAGQVEESRKPAAAADGVKFLRMEKNVAVFEVGSGSYSFTSRMGMN